MAKTRLAPSPTGALHLGNARTFALTWLAARASGATMALRIEDIDASRKKPGAVELLLEDLRWLGIDFDGAPMIQTEFGARHLAALQMLIDQGLVYPCVCTRKDIEGAQSAPHIEEESHYPGICDGRFADIESAAAGRDRPVALRFRVPDEEISFEDEVAGRITSNPRRQGGDFVVARFEPNTGFAVGYQLAVVVDDAAAHVDWVIRGDDLLISAPRQMLIQRALGLSPCHYAHVPLVTGIDGKKLAKRHGDTRIAAYREAGVSAPKILQWIAGTSGCTPLDLQNPRTSGFRLSQVPKHHVVLLPHRLQDGPPLTSLDRQPPR